MSQNLDQRLNNKHRHFVQFMLTNGTVPIEKALKFYRNLDPGHANNPMLRMKTLISQINYKMSNQFCKIVIEVCEVTNRTVMMWLNMKNDAITQKQSNFTGIELEYFHNVMTEILSSDTFCLLYPQCINISSHLSGTLSRENAEKRLLKWVSEGYFVKDGVNMYLGPKTIHEFAVYLKNTVPETCICGLCSSLSFIGEVCPSCSQKFHTTCINKYLQGQVTCPNCQQNWTAGN